MLFSSLCPVYLFHKRIIFIFFLLTYYLLLNLISSCTTTDFYSKIVSSVFFLFRKKLQIVKKIKKRYNEISKDETWEDITLKIEQKTKAVIYMLISALGFTLMSVAVKAIPGIPLFEKVFFRNLISCFVAFLLLLREKRGFYVVTENRVPIFIRSFLGFLGVVTNFYAVQHLILADSNMLGKLSPITVSFFAVLYLKEKVDKEQILGIVLSFVGALFVIKPSFSLSMLPSLAGLTSVTFAGISYTVIRYLNDKENPNIIVFYFSLMSVLCSLPFMMANFQIPSLKEWFFLMGIGFMACMAQFFMTYSYKNAEASEVAVYNYSGIPYGIILGYLLFDEIPDIYSYIGGTIIIAMAIYLYLHNKKKKANNIGKL